MRFLGLQCLIKITSQQQFRTFSRYTKTRIDQLFNIIIEFPESQPALEDIKECLKKTTDLRSHLTSSLKNVLETKCVVLGVSTTDILTAYISAIKVGTAANIFAKPFHSCICFLQSLQVLDPSGVILEIVCEPVRRYLRTREDTVRSIVQSLIDDSSSELADELKKNEGLCLDESFDEEDEMEHWETWLPGTTNCDHSAVVVPRH